MSFLKRIRTGGTVLTPTMYDKVRERFRAHHSYAYAQYPIISSGYGCTEAGGLIFECGHFSPQAKQRTTVGRKVIDDDIKIKIINDHGEEQPSGTIGEIVIHSPNQMINYLCDRGSKPIKWIHTNDQGDSVCPIGKKQTINFKVYSMKKDIYILSGARPTQLHLAT